MSKTAYSTAAVVASAALLTVGTPTVSQAHTDKELSLCYINKTLNPALDLELVADGPSYKTASLDAGQCEAWDVRPGQYKITLESIEDLAAQASAGQVPCAKGTVSALRITVKRMNESYQVFYLAFVKNGSFTTDVKKDRRTSVTFMLFCDSSP